MRECEDCKYCKVIPMVVRGVMDPNSGGSQFFIMHTDVPYLDGDYATFGKITEGLEAIDTIVNQPRDAMDKPNTPQIMKKVTIEEE